MNFRFARSEGVIEAVRDAEGPSATNAWQRLEALYRSSRDDVFAYAVTLLGDRAAAEDVTALAFERAYRRHSTFDRGRGPERAWLFGIARNAALDELRRRRRLTGLTVDPGDDGEAVTSTEDQTEGALRRATVRVALARLPARDREVIGLKFHAGLSYGEIAQVLGIAESAAGTLLYRAMQKLRRECDVQA